MARIGNARTIADIEYVVEPPGIGSDVTTWTSHGVNCSIDRHRFSGQDYAFRFEVMDLRLDDPPKQRWHVVIINEVWQFRDAKTDSRGSKSLRVLRGKPTDVLNWMRKHRELKLLKKTDFM
ncbi:hypothetical protein [Bradyrhizobium sp. dw_411]|uniref:hypothetical protein n=1 Tax=Bradyrhizobium sp. dw_411 TaxID=2720082 RepID=UPI001BCE9AE7|nr:hypothetical protein [Bradyrhizobium sp. dw_411]